MGEFERRKETINRGELFYLHHPGTENIFSGYGLTTQVESKELLVGLIMVHRPRPVDPKWLLEVEAVSG